ncbi:Chlorovirus glycoprotein repeat domain-containing protein [Paramecium bursaria Chlorella virus NE-JV-1]|nr:Chlorovirus glycoprotein repeat domain-containing protein [Paramecium bursaria Chlorella virus NE-JV-1]
MSSFISANPVISTGSAQKFEILEAVIKDLLVTGQLIYTGNVGNVTNLILDSIVARIGNIDQLTSNVANITNLFTGDIITSGNISASYFLGNGSLLTGVAASGGGGNVVITTDDYLIANSTPTSTFIGVNDVNASNKLVSTNEDGKIYQTNLNGYLIIPEGYTSNVVTRLQLGDGDLPIGSIVRQVDDSQSYMLLSSPSNVESNWITFDGTNFPVNTIFGRNGDVLASYGDYFDNYVELSANVGPVPSGDSVANALAYLDAKTSAKYSKFSPSAISIDSEYAPITFNTFHATGASNVDIVRSGSMFVNEGDARVFTVSARVELADAGESSLIVALNGNLANENVLAKTLETSANVVHSVSCPIFLQTMDYFEVSAKSSSPSMISSGLLTILQ